MMGLLPFYSINTALLLIALAMGYFVLAKAQKLDAKGFKVTGYVIGTFVITFCAILIVNKLAMDLKMSGRMNRMRGMMAQKGMMPPQDMPEGKLPKAPRR
jgi:hypothetical protein